MKSFFPLLVVFLLTIEICHAQKATVSGKVMQETDKSLVRSAYIFVKGTYTGAMTDSLGKFKLVAAQLPDSIQVVSIGYQKKTIGLQKGHETKLEIYLTPEVYSLQSIDVRPGVNPAFALLKKVIERKGENDPANLPPWHANVYNKVEIDLKNIKRPDKKRRIWRQFDFIYNHIDTLEADKKPFLPVFITETLSEVYHEKNKENLIKITGTKASGMQTSLITDFTGQLYGDVNPYDNFIPLGDIGLISPFNRQGLIYYKYSLLDSAVVEHKKIYELSFKPKLPQEPTFKGKFWIADSTFAITRIEFFLSGNVNVNFLNNLVITKAYQFNGERWLPQEEHVFADLNLKKGEEKKMIGFLGRKTTFYKNYDFVSRPLDASDRKAVVFSNEQDLNKDDKYWEENRPMKLLKQEAGIYSMVDSLKDIPLFKTAADYIQMFFFGYKDMGKYELGPYNYFISFNKIEGSRFRFGGRTTAEFSPNIRLNGFLAYGFGDFKFKYGGGFDYFFNKSPRFSISPEYERDYKLLGKSENAFSEDNILNSLLSKRATTKLNLIDSYDLKLNKEWTNTFSNQLEFNRRRIFSSPYVPFINQAGNIVESLTASELTLNTRIASDEKFILGDFDKRRLGSKYPVINLNLTMGLKNVFGSDYNYTKLNINIYDKLNLNPFGYTTYYLQAGKIWGDVPFPLLKIHEGNETYAFDIMAFNLLEYQNFVSDQYASLFLEHHFQGFFLNKIPLLMRLKWREVVGFRMLAGSLDSTQHQQFKFPGNMSGLGSAPYMETSVGIENILKVIRVDAVWRLNYKNPNTTRLGLMFSFQFSL